MDIIFIVGVGRSGTSAITRILSLCGAALPSRLLRAGSGNPTGYWEPEVSLKRNDQFLHAVGSSYHDPSLRAVDLSALDLKARAVHARNISAFLEALPAADVAVVKDPRISGLVEAWEAACRKLGHVPKFVHMFRNPIDVAASLKQRYGLPIEHALALWLKYNLVPERMTRQAPRAYVSYRELMSGWRNVVRRCNQLLDLELAYDSAIAAEIDGFLVADLHHHQASEMHPLNDPNPARWVQRTYSELQQAAIRGAPDIGAMDRIFEEYAGAERFFGTALRSYQEHFAAGVQTNRQSAPPDRIASLAELPAKADAQGQGSGG